MSAVWVRPRYEAMKSYVATTVRLQVDRQIDRQTDRQTVVTGMWLGEAAASKIASFPGTQMYGRSTP